MKASFPAREASWLRRSGGREPGAGVARVFSFLGADPALVDVVLGDLAEERAARTKRDGARAARWWYVRESLRSVPHLVASAVRIASWRRRAMLMLCLATSVFAVTFAVWRVLSWDATPALLLARGDLGDGIVVNNVRPVQLSMRVLDSAGHLLPDTGVRFRWLSGTPVPVTSRGVATCTQSGDAVVRASLGRLVTQLVLRCRPVNRVRALWGIKLIVGDSAVGVPFVAFDRQGRIVTLLRGELSVEDSSVATLEVAADGTRRVRARAPGSTMLDIHIGDRAAGTGVHVYQRASSPEGIRPGQQLATPIALAAGEMRQWQIPAGHETYNFSMLSDGDEMHVPRLAIMGANCVTLNDPGSFMCVALHGASLFVFHSRDGDQSQVERGKVTVWRHAWP